MKLFTIGEAAEIVGVSPSTLRFWEREGLISPQRTSGGARRFTWEQVKRLKKIKELKAKGSGAYGIKKILKEDLSSPPVESLSLGDKIRRLRQRKGMTLQDFSRKTALSIAFLSQVERGKANLSVANLRKIADALGVNTIYFFEGGPSTRKLVKAGERKSLPTDFKGVRMELLAEGATAMEPHIFYIEPGAGSEEAYSHQGEEFIFVLEGKLEIWLDEIEHYILEPGDTLYFNSSSKHRWRNPTKNMTVVLWVNTPPTF